MTLTIVPWPRGRCEYWLTRGYCGKPGRWMVGGQVMCGQHKQELEKKASKSNTSA